MVKMLFIIDTKSILVSVSRFVQNAFIPTFVDGTMGYVCMNMVEETSIILYQQGTKGFFNF